MEDRYALELHTPEGYRLCRLSAGAEYACAVFTLTCTEAAETVKLELRAAELIAAGGAGVRGGHYAAGSVLTFTSPSRDRVQPFVSDTRGRRWDFSVLDLAKLRDRFLGCLAGGAAGDALGYAVEFMDWSAIEAQYGPRGIRDFALTGSIAQISDDTQMTLFTLAGLLNALRRAPGDDHPPEADVNAAYHDWLCTQEQLENETTATWLFADPRLHSPRAPGITCLEALEAQLGSTAEPPYGTLASPPNNSKGCGAVMRAAPAGMVLHSGNCGESAAMAAAKTGVLTHGHPLGYLSAALLAALIHNLLYQQDRADGAVWSGGTLADEIRYAMQTVAEEFAGTPQLDELTARCERALRLAAEPDGDDVANIHALGGGWVGEEALAIAFYAAVKYERDFHAAMCCAVNHSGDSDSTGAIAGNILGACRGYASIAAEGKLALDRLELLDTMTALADQALDAVAAGLAVLPQAAPKPRTVRYALDDARQRMLTVVYGRERPASYEITAPDGGFVLTPAAAGRLYDVLSEASGEAYLVGALRSFFAGGGDLRALLEAKQIPFDEY